MGFLLYLSCTIFNAEPARFTTPAVSFAASQDGPLEARDAASVAPCVAPQKGHALKRLQRSISFLNSARRVFTCNTGAPGMSVALARGDAGTHLSLRAAEAAQVLPPLIFGHHDVRTRLAHALQDGDDVLEIPHVEDRQLEANVACVRLLSPAWWRLRRRRAP